MAKYVQKDRPTLLQLRVLEELLAGGNYRGFVSDAAARLGCSPPSVTQFLKKCVANGWLSDDYRFTAAGQTWAESYLATRDRLQTHLEQSGLPREEMETNLSALLEHIDQHVLNTLLQGAREEEPVVFRRARLSTEAVERIEWRLPRQADFCFYRSEPDRNGNMFSMANEAFDQTGWLVEHGGQVCLQLTTRRIRGISRADGREYTGSLSQMRYGADGLLTQAEMDQGRLWLPLKDFRFTVGDGDELKGLLWTAITSTVGRIHMPESTALLVLWL